MTRRRRPGFLLVGKSNAPENGWSISTEPKLYGATHNPWSEGITAGGSSGGSCRGRGFAHGADRRGQRWRRLDPRPGLLLRHRRAEAVARAASRLAPASATIWYGGAYFLCISRTVRDTAAYLDAVAGALPGDPYTPPVPAESWLALSARAPKKLRIGFTVTPPDGSPIDPEVMAAVLQHGAACSSASATMSRSTTWRSTRKRLEDLHAYELRADGGDLRLPGRRWSAGR